MKTLKIADGIHMLTMNAKDVLFEGMWEVKNGFTLNSYIVQGDKTAIIDGVIGWDGVPETLYQYLNEIGVNPEKIDYVVINHMEPDHSGWISSFRKIKDDFTIICTTQAAKLVASFYGEDKIQVVKDGDTLDLGNGKVLRFHPAPNVHWPETMFTYELSTQTLFTCDMFGAFGAMEDHHFDDELTSDEKEMFEAEAERYYSNVLTTFTPSVRKAIEKAKTLEIKIIAPGHGPVYRSKPQEIIDDYTLYTKYAEGFGKKEVSIIWGSMYGMTAKTLPVIEKTLQSQGIKYHLVELPKENIGQAVTKVFSSAGVIIAAPTYEYKLFPPVAEALSEFGRKRISNKVALRLGSYGWTGGAERELHEIIERYNMKWDLADSVEFEGMPKEEDLKKIEVKVLELIERMKEKVLE